MKDPADSLKGKIIDQEVKEAEKTFDIENITTDMLKPIPQRVEKGSHAFDGYPQKKVTITQKNRNNKIVEVPISLTHLVILNPNQPVVQDPSGEGMTHTMIGGMRKGQEVKRTLETFHSRFIQDFDIGGINTDWIFDRKIEFGDGKIMQHCCIIPSHSARAQICFKIVKERIMVDNRYILADIKQAQRLRRLFQQISLRNQKAELNAKKHDDESASEEGDI